MRDVVLSLGVGHACATGSFVKSYARAANLGPLRNEALKNVGSEGRLLSIT